MLLEKGQVEKYRREISGLYQEYLGENNIAGLIHFGIISHNNLVAVAALKCYGGAWYLRNCAVKPDARGRKLQRKLIRERESYLIDNGTKNAWVSVFPDNSYSIRNIEAEGYEFIRKKTLDTGQEVLIYKKQLDTSSRRKSLEVRPSGRKEKYYQQ